MLTERQLRLAIGDQAFDAIPDARPQKASRPAREPRSRRPRIERRQAIALGGSVPAIVAVGFTMAEIAVLCVLAAEHRAHGYCDLSLAELGAAAGCCRSVAQNTIYWAERRGIVVVTRRRIAHDRNLPNIVRIASPVWRAWLRLGPARPRPWGGSTDLAGAHLQSKKEAGERVPTAKLSPAGGRWCSFRGSPMGR